MESLEMRKGSMREVERKKKYESTGRMELAVHEAG
jgi:hypothetical protein